MGSFSDYWENAVLDHLFGKGNYSPPTVFVGLSTSNPGEDGAGLSEPTGGNYARVPTAASDWNIASNGTLTNAGLIAFDEATSSWGTLTHFALFDAVSAGHFVAYGSLATSKTIGNGDVARFNPGGLSITLD